MNEQDAARLRTVRKALTACSQEAHSAGHDPDTLALAPKKVDVASVLCNDPLCFNARGALRTLEWLER